MACVAKKIDAGDKPIYAQGTGPGTGKEGVVVGYDKRMSWIKVHFVGTDPDIDSVEENFGDQLELDKWVALRIASLTANAQTKASVEALAVDGAIQPADLTLTPQQSFDLAVLVFLSAKRFLPLDHPDVAKAQNAMMALYKPEYIGL